MDLAEFTRRYHYAAVMIGPTQWGKTEAVKEYARRHPDKVVLVRCPCQPVLRGCFTGLPSRSERERR